MIKVQCTIQAPVSQVWEKWTGPAHICKWNNASPDWHTPHAENDLRTGGKFLSRMEARDGSFGFDFWGIYDEVIPEQKISYTIGDGRKAEIAFTAQGENTQIIETFEAENQNPEEMQRAGWQAILDNFKRYVENS
ncbi:MAG: SRPBCC family protein [Sphingobacteriaceae bacterium]